MNNKDEIIKNYDWCLVIKRLDKFILRFDSGRSAGGMIEIEVSKSEAKTACVDQYKAEEIIRKYY